MILFHEPVQVIDEPVSGVFGVFVVDPDVNGLHRANLLTHSAEDAAELINLVDDGIPIPLIVFASHKADTVGGTDGGAKAAGDALRPPVCVNLHPMRSPPVRRHGHR